VAEWSRCKEVPTKAAFPGWYRGIVRHQEISGDAPKGRCGPWRSRKPQDLPGEEVCRQPLEQRRQIVDAWRRLAGTARQARERPRRCFFIH